MGDEARTWKAVAYDKANKALDGASISAACNWMLGGNALILVFKDNNAAKDFAKAMALEVKSNG